MNLPPPLRRLCLPVAAGLALLAAPVSAAELRLMMIEQAGCIYCARWNEEVAPEYSLTDEGKAAPLLRQDLRAPLPPGIVIDRPAVFTPTFVLLVDGTESARIEGYPGEDFFWPMLGQMIAAAPHD